jgi:phosphoglycolate phosphatase
VAEDYDILAALFDIDLTLIDSGGAGSVGWRKAFDDLYGVPADIGKFTDAGMTDPEVGRLTFKAVVGHEPSEKELQEVLDRRQHYLPEAVAESKTYRVMPGVVDTLERLTKAGYLLGITTGGTKEAGETKIERGRLNHFFSFGGFGSDSSDRVELTKRAIERAGKARGEPMEARQCAVLGDTPHDTDAARGAGAMGIGVATGHFTVEQLRGAGAEYAVKDLTKPLPFE